MARGDYIQYHGIINSVKKDPKNTDYKIITIRPEYPSNAPAKEYSVHEIFMKTTDDKFSDRHVLVNEKTSGELLKIIIDDTYSNKENISKDTEVLFRYDFELYQDYKRISMHDILTIFRRDITRNLNAPEKSEYFATIFAAMPLYIKQYGNIQLYEQDFLEKNRALSSGDSEKIHFFYAAYITAYKLENNNIHEYTDEEQIFLNDGYDLYFSKVVNPDEDLIPRDIFIGYVYRFIDEIKNAKKGYKTTVREKHILSMYTELLPQIKYYFLEGTPTYPISDKEYSKIVTLFHIQKIFKKYSSFDDFTIILEDLVNVVYNHNKHLIDAGLPERIEMDGFIFDGEIHENDIFCGQDGVHLLLDQLFGGGAANIREDNNVNHNTTYWYDLDQFIREELQHPYRIYWFYYCVQVLDDIYNKCIENKDGNTI